MEIELAPELQSGLEDVLARGGCIFPICSNSKLPLPLSGHKIGKPNKGGYKLATNDPRVIWHYFRGDALPLDIPNGAINLLKLWRKATQPNAAIALDMSDMLVLDADDLNELEEFKTKYGNLPDTYCIKSPRAGGGLHYYFKAPNINYRKTIEGFPHLDVKYHGYVLIAGSVKRDDSGEIIGRYKVINNSPIADLPEWLLELVKRPLASVGGSRPQLENDWDEALYEWTLQRASSYLSKMSPAISGQGGHGATFAAALAMARGFGLSEEDAYELLAKKFNPRCEPPWSEWELRHKVRSAMESVSTPFGYLLGVKEAEQTKHLEDHPKEESNIFDIPLLWKENK